MCLVQTTAVGNKDGNAVTVVIKHPFVSDGRIDVQEIPLAPQIPASNIFIRDKMAARLDAHRDARDASVHRIHKRIDEDDAIPQRTGTGNQREMRAA